jgi:threonine synthase
MEAKREIDGAGVGCEPASAASVAGVRRMVGEGLIKESDRVVAVLTGHLLKDPSTVADPEFKPVEIDANIFDLERALG